MTSTMTQRDWQRRVTETYEILRLKDWGAIQNHIESKQALFGIPGPMHSFIDANSTLEQVQYLVKHGAYVVQSQEEDKRGEGDTILTQACSWSSKAVIQFLLEQPVKRPPAVSQQAYSLCMSNKHLATIQDVLDVWSLLLKAGVSEPTFYRLFPIDYCLKKYELQTTIQLLELAFKHDTVIRSNGEFWFDSDTDREPINKWMAEHKMQPVPIYPNFFGVKSVDDFKAFLTHVESYGFKPAEKFVDWVNWTEELLNKRHLVLAAHVIDTYSKTEYFKTFNWNRVDHLSALHLGQEDDEEKDAVAFANKYILPRINRFTLCCFVTNYLSPSKRLLFANRLTGATMDDKKFFNAFPSLTS